LLSPSATSIRARVPKPRIVSLGEVTERIADSRSSRSVFVQLTGDGSKAIKRCTVAQLQAALKERSEYPPETPAYVVMKTAEMGLNAWPIIWVGEHARRLVMLGYHDPVRFGIKSQSTDPLTMAPDVPWPLEKREFGTYIDFELPRGRKRSKVLFKPMGEQVTSRQLTSRYDADWIEVIGDCLEAELDREKGQQRRFEATKTLPTHEEYEQLARKKFTKTVQEMTDNAYGTVEELGEELREAFDNMPESLQDTDVGNARDEAATMCEDIAFAKPEVPDAVARITIYRRPQSRGDSRRIRAAEAAAILEAVISEIETKTGEDCDSEVSQFVKEVNESVGEIDGIEFPGMFG